MNAAELVRRVTWRVVRLPDKAGGALASFGSAVVVRGGWFAAALEGRSLVLTCTHVCSGSGEPGPPRPLAPERAGIDFDDGEQRSGALAVRGVIWESPRDELDAALLDVEELPAWSREAATALSTLSVREMRVARQEELAAWISLRGYLMNQPAQLARPAVPVAAVRSPYLYYDVETGRGLSGAPLFDDAGALVGLHRGDSRVLPAELALAPRHGVEIAEILDAARLALAGG